MWNFNVFVGWGFADTLTLASMHYPGEEMFHNHTHAQAIPIWWLCGWHP